MSKMIIFFSIVILLIAALWIYEHHSSAIKEYFYPQKIKHEVKQKTNGFIHSNEHEKFSSFIKQKDPSGIIIYTREDPSTAQDVCGDKKRRHMIVILTRSSPHLNELKRWGIKKNNLNSPYTIIIKDGNIIIQTTGVICNY